MANAFFAPFNHQPTSITFHTAPVTLGSDEYARLIVLPQTGTNDGAWQGDQGITLDGNLIYPQLNWETNDHDSGEDITMPVAGTLYYFYSSGTGNINYYVNGSGVFSNGLGTPGTGPHTAEVSSGDELNISISSGISQAWLKPYESLQKEFWLAPSTVISSGDGSITIPYMLERYAAIS